MAALSAPGIGVRVEASVLAADVPAFGVVAELPAAGIVVLFIGAEGFAFGVVSAGIVIVPEVDGRTVGSVDWA